MRDVPTWKTQVPGPSADWVTRRRLQDRLHRAARLPLTLVVAPAGYGKTTLLAEFAHECPYPLAWLSLDESDRDWITFIEDVVAALQGTHRRLGQKSLAAARHAGSDSRAALAFSGMLVAELAAVPGSVGLVLEDWYRVDSSDDVRAATQLLVDRLPPNAHLFLSSRVRPTLDLTGRVARREMGAIGWTELAFTPDEAEALLAARNSALPPAEARSLAEAAEGWAMGMLLAVDGGVTGSIRGARDRNTSLADYLTRAVFDDLSAAQQEVLLVASLLEPISADVCDRLLGQRGSAHVLQELSERRLVSADGRSWRLHHLIGGYLRTRLESSDPARYHALRRQLAEESIATGDLPHAIEQLLACGEYERVVELLEQHGESIGNTGRWRAITSWVGVIPETAVGRSPALLALWARAAIRLGNPQQGLILAARAVDVARLHGDDSAAVWARLIYAHGLFSVGRSGPAVEICQEVLDDEAVRGDIVKRAEAERTLAVASGRLGRFAIALAHIETALALFDRLADLPNVAYALNSAGLYCSSLGRLEPALAYFGRARALRQALEDDAGVAVVDANLAEVHLLRGDYAEAIQQLERSVATDERLEDRRGLAAHLTILGRAYWAAGDTDRAARTYQRALVVCNDAHYPIGVVEALVGLANLARGESRYNEARQLAREARGEAEMAGSASLRGLCELTLGAITRDAGRPADALQHFGDATVLMREAGQREGEARAAFGAALTHSDTRDVARALAALDDALAIAAEMGTHAFLLSEGDTVGPLLEAAAPTVSPASPAARVLEDLQRLEQLRATGAHHDHARKARVTLVVRAFGPGVIEMGDRSIGPADWHRAKARDLFFAISSAPRGLSRVELQGSIWPDVPEAQLAAQWRSALYTARSTVAPVWIVEQDGRYELATDPPGAAWCDVRAFESAVARGRSLADEERAACYREAVALVEGPFLTSSTATWAYERRIQLDALYEDCLTWLAHWAETCGRYDEALRYAEELLARDDDQEEIHALTLRCHLGARNPRLAVRHYRNYVRRARRRGLEPATELARLHERALSLP